MAKTNTGAKVAKGKMQSTWLSNALKSVGAKLCIVLLLVDVNHA